MLYLLENFNELSYPCACMDYRVLTAVRQFLPAIMQITLTE